MAKAASLPNCWSSLPASFSAAEVLRVAPVTASIDRSMSLPLVLRVLREADSLLISASALLEATERRCKLPVRSLTPLLNRPRFLEIFLSMLILTGTVMPFSWVFICLVTAVIFLGPLKITCALMLNAIITSYNKKWPYLQTVKLSSGMTTIPVSIKKSQLLWLLPQPLRSQPPPLLLQPLLQLQPQPFSSLVSFFSSLAYLRTWIHQ